MAFHQTQLTACQAVALNGLILPQALSTYSIHGWALTFNGLSMCLRILSVGGLGKARKDGHV